MRRWVSGLPGYAGNARAGLVRVSLLALAIALGMGSAGGPPGTVSAAPVSHTFTVTAGTYNPTPSGSSHTDYLGYSSSSPAIGSISPSTFTYEGTTHTVQHARIERFYTRSSSGLYNMTSKKVSVSVTPGLQGRWVGASISGASASPQWNCPSVSTTCTGSHSIWNNIGGVTSATIRLHNPWSLGTPTGTFVTTNPENIRLRVSAGVNDAGPRVPAALTWTISPTPTGVTSPVNQTATGTNSASPTIGKTFSGLSAHTTYTVTVKKQGAADSTAKSVQAIYAPPGAVTLGAPSGVFSGAGPFRHTLTVTLPASVPDDASATQAPLTWTIDPTPPGATSPEHLIGTISGSGNVVKTFSGLSPFTPYTITARQYGADDSDAVSLTAIKIPDQTPYPAPAIAKVQDQTPGDAETAALLITWDQAPAAPVTGYMLRYNEGTPLEPITGRERNIVRQLPPVPRTVGKVDIQALAYYSAGEVVTYRGRDLTVPTGEHWFTTWSEPYSINISQPSEAGEYVPPHEVTPLVVETFENVLPVMGIPAEHAPNYALLFLFFLTVGAGGFLYVTTGGGAMSAALGGMVAVIIWSGLGWWWFGLPVPMALVPVVIIILGGGTIVTSRILA